MSTAKQKMTEVIQSQPEDASCKDIGSSIFQCQ